MKSTKKRRGRPPGTSKTLKNMVSGKTTVKKASTESYYPLEDLVYTKPGNQDLYIKVVNSAIRATPGQAFFVPEKDMNGAKPNSFASGARTYLSKDKRTAKWTVAVQVVSNKQAPGVRFYIKDVK